MSDPDESAPEAPAEGPDAVDEARRKRRLAEMFGDVLPDGTTDERSESWGEGAERTRDDEWLRNQVPPHHG